VRAEYPVTSLGVSQNGQLLSRRALSARHVPATAPQSDSRSAQGKMGSGFIFDTNSLHKGVPEGRLARTTVVLEYHRSPKCPAIQSLKLPIPCPSGDQHIVSVAGEQKSARAQLTCAQLTRSADTNAPQRPSARSGRTQRRTMPPAPVPAPLPVRETAVHHPSSSRRSGTTPATPCPPAACSGCHCLRRAAATALSWRRLWRPMAPRAGPPALPGWCRTQACARRCHLGIGPF
jgi:hypothetical protein